jgi:hypothetical protein
MTGFPARCRIPRDDYDQFSQAFSKPFGPARMDFAPAGAGREIRQYGHAARSHARGEKTRPVDRGRSAIEPSEAHFARTGAPNRSVKRARLGNL